MVGITAIMPPHRREAELQDNRWQNGWFAGTGTVLGISRKGERGGAKDGAYKGEIMSEHTYTQEDLEARLCAIRERHKKELKAKDEEIRALKKERRSALKEGEGKRRN